MANDNDNNAPYAPAGIAQGAAVIADLEANWRLRSVSVNEAAARRLQQLGMSPAKIAEWLGGRR